MRLWLKSGIVGMLALAWAVIFFSRLPGSYRFPLNASTIPVADGTAESISFSPAPLLNLAPGFPQPLAVISDLELLQLARTFVSHSPAQTIAWAGAQPDPLLRQRMILAMLHAWGELDPVSAVNWALGQDETAREVDLQAALTGASCQPKMAMQVLRDLLAKDADTGGACGAIYARVLVADGKFQEALQFINRTPANSLKDSVKTLYRQWAKSHPLEALQSVDSVLDPALREAAFQTSVDAWKGSNPAGLAAYAQIMPAGEKRDYALTTALDSWSLQDPTEFATWLNTLPQGKEFDLGAALMIAKSDGANRTPEMAMEWVENISDPALRLQSLQRVLEEWGQSDKPAALQYLANASWLDESRRQTLFQSLVSVQSGTE